MDPLAVLVAAILQLAVQNAAAFEAGKAVGAAQCTMQREQRAARDRDFFRGPRLPETGNKRY